MVAAVTTLEPLIAAAVKLGPELMAALVLVAEEVPKLAVRSFRFAGQEQTAGFVGFGSIIWAHQNLLAVKSGVVEPKFVKFLAVIKSSRSQLS